jgi:predicted transcriptional regulator
MARALAASVDSQSNLSMTQQELLTHGFDRSVPRRWESTYLCFLRLREQDTAVSTDAVEKGLKELTALGLVQQKYRSSADGIEYLLTHSGQLEVQAMGSQGIALDSLDALGTRRPGNPQGMPLDMAILLFLNTCPLRGFTGSSIAVEFKTPSSLVPPAMGQLIKKGLVIKRKRLQEEWGSVVFYRLTEAGLQHRRLLMQSA